MLSDSTRAAAADCGAAFRAAEPFRHCQIEDFFDAAFADALAAQFPAFERGNARNEQGELGGKSTVERITDLGSAYQALDALVQSQAFLDWLSEATGIPDLLYDPHYFGGGTHDNRHGQELDPHVDFNRHPLTGWHRRLNLIVYLNREWAESWGGALELHSDPRRDGDEIKLILPHFNHCVIFETTERSWHGFGRIKLPGDQKHRSRKSIALYFYSRERPVEELAGRHATIYVDRPLPSHLVAGHTLAPDDIDEIATLLTRRDQHNARLYRELVEAAAEIDHLRDAARGSGWALREAISGTARFAGSSRDAEAFAAWKAACLPLAGRIPEPIRDTLRRLARGGQRKPPS